MLLIKKHFHQILYLSVSLCYCAIQQKNSRSRLSQMFYKLDVLANFARFRGKHLCRSFFLIKLEPSGPQLFLKIDSNTVFSCEFCEIFQDSFSTEHLRTTSREIRRIYFLRIYFCFFG